MKTICYFALIFLLGINLETLSAQDQKEYSYPLGDAVIKILVYEKENPQNVTYFNMHDDENTCVEAVRTKLQQGMKGKLIELQHSGQRLITFSHKGIFYSIDPNRMFSKAGIEKNLRYYGNYSEEALVLVDDFAQWLVKNFLKDSKIIIALHNNRNTAGFSVKSFAPGGNFQADAPDTFINPEMGTGDFFYVNEKVSFDFFREEEYSVVLQNNQSIVDDGSLSVYSGSNKLYYVNIEAEHFHLEQQIKMLEVLQNLLGLF